MTKVFLGGSRHVARLNAQVRERLDNIINKGLPVIVGDANGADKAIQQYLHEKSYRNVEVFCTGKICRNNVGHWTAQLVKTNAIQRDFSFYSAKDRVMTSEATFGLMIWDGKSIGTLLNIWRLLNSHKKVVVYATPEKQFCELRNFQEWNDFISHYDHDLKIKVEQKAALESKNRDGSQPAFGF